MTAPTAEGTRPMVELRGVHKAFGALEVLRGVDLTVRAGEVTVLLGPSGSGKSTLLRSINHLEKVDRGFVRVDGDLIGYRQAGDRLHELSERHILRQRSHIGFVFQSFNLFGHLTVLDNVVEAPVSAQGRDRAETVRRARELLDRVGLADKADEYPRRLSGGQQQRVAIALNALIKNGTYAQVLQRWNLSNEAVPGSQVNPPGLPRT
jgi:polar amino acid transport system ATP-binding protein